LQHKIFLIASLFFVVSTTICYGQEISISGFVDDAQGGPVTYANVLVMKANDSTVIKGVSTSDLGFFLLEGLVKDDYLVKISFLGFKDFFQMVSLKENIDLGTIVLEEASETLDEISIIVKKPTLKKEADRLVFNIENTALIEGNMFQVLKSTPGILILNNNIQVKNSTPTVFINDKKVHLSNDELVQLLEGSSANSIKSVEVITNPSSKYDAESGAVINIVMSKNFITGYRGNVFANYTQGIYPRYEAGMSHFFKSEKIDFFANYTYSDSKIDRSQRDEINYLDTNNDINQTFKSLIGRTTWSKTHNFNFNFDYSFNDTNTLSLSSSTLWMPYFKYSILNSTDVLNSNQNLDFYYDSNNLSNDNKYNIGFDLDYVHKFKTAGEKFAVNTHYTTYNYTRDQNVFSNYFDADDTFLQSTAFRTDNNQDTKILIAKADYTLPIKETSILEIGAKGSNIKISSDIMQFDIVNNQEMIDLNNSDAFNYDEDIYAGYINYSKDWEKLSLILGLRAEYTKLDGFSVSDNVANKQNYLEWFPTASFHYSFSDNFSLYTNYKRSIERPGYQDLNPFQFFLNDFTIVTGNPNLLPVFIDHTVIGTSFYKDIFTIEAYYKKSGNRIFQLPRQDNTNSTLTYTPINIDSTIDYGFDFLVNFDVTNRWSIYFVTSFYNTKDEGVFDNTAVTRSQWANFSQTSQNVTFLKDRSLTANLSITYATRNTQAFTLSDELLFSEISMSKSIFNKKGTLSLAVSDLFNTQDFNTVTKYLNQNSSNHINFDTRYIKLGFRYKFGNTKLQTNQRTKEQQETDRLEIDAN
jgi:outer membrane receptor protein involved in Fe transport